MPKAFSEREKGLIHSRLLEQGSRLFSTYGLKKTNIEEIARAVGISKGAFYAFYSSKEALFLDVLEQTEIRVRRELLATADLPGPSPRLRLLALFKKACALFLETPILKAFSGSDFELLFRRVPAEKIQEHMAADLAFFLELVTYCQKAGIPIRVPVEEIAGLLYPLVLALLHQGDIENALDANLDGLLELVAAYCLGEVELQQDRPHIIDEMQKGGRA